jgi:hypothetical protein
MEATEQTRARTTRPKQNRPLHLRRAVSHASSVAFVELEPAQGEIVIRIR